MTCCNMFLRTCFYCDRCSTQCFDVQFFLDCSTAHALVLSIRAIRTAVHYILNPTIIGCDL